MNEQIEKSLQSLFERDQETEVKRKKAELEKAHARVRPTLEKITELSGIDGLTVLKAAVRTSWHSGLTWYETLAVIHSFYVDKHSIEKGE